MVNSDVIIRLQGISFAYPGNPSKLPVLDNLNLEIRSGERVGLIGSNGSGKSTLFHLIMGLLRPNRGAIELFGEERLNEKDFRGVRGRIGFLFQDSDDQLFCPTVAEDVAFGPLNLGNNSEEAMTTVHEVLGRLGLDGFEDRLTYKLSGGEKRLVSLATVLAMRPEVLILDEPTTGLDDETVERITDLLIDANLTYIVASHNETFLERTTNVVYRLVQGTIAREKPRPQASSMQS